MAQAVFVKITQEKRRFIYITLKAKAQTPLALFWRFDMIEIQKGGRNENRMNRTRSETREAGSIADGAQRGNTGQRIHCKGGEQTEICFQMCERGRGYYGGLPAIRAHKVKRTPRTRGAHSKRCTTNNNYYQLTRSAKNDN